MNTPHHCFLLWNDGRKLKGIAKRSNGKWLIRIEWHNIPVDLQTSFRETATENTPTHVECIVERDELIEVGDDAVS